MSFALIADPGMARALRSGRKTQARVSMASALSSCVPGDRIWVREACVPGRHGAGQDFITPLRKAEFVMFPDGWRQYRDGSGQQGRPPSERDSDDRWVTAMHMPRWASRLTLAVSSVRTERLQQITRRDIRAEGALPVLGGLLWRWPQPIGGVALTARRAFAACWSIDHATPGERWEDDPLVIVLGFHVETPQP
jgi:hypothetical protein